MVMKERNTLGYLEYAIDGKSLDTDFRRLANEFGGDSIDTVILEMAVSIENSHRRLRCH